MSSNFLEYKGFLGSVEFSAEDKLLAGRILDVEALIAFSAESVADVEIAFHEAVDEYIADCERRQVKPEKPCSGTFNVRVGADLHRRANSAARKYGETLNAFMCKTLARELEKINAVEPMQIPRVWLKTTPFSVDPRWDVESAGEGVPGMSPIFGIPPLTQARTTN